MLSLFHVGHNYWHPIIAMSFSQGNSSEFSPIMSEEFGETPDKRSETISSYRISPDPSDSQLHVGASPLQFTSLIFYRVQVRGRNSHSRSLVLWSVTHFCVVFEVCVWIIVRLEDPNMAHYKISSRVSHLLIFYLLVFDRIHDAMCLNKMFRTSSRKIGPQHKKYSSIFHCTHGVLFIPVFTKPILSVCC